MRGALRHPDELKKSVARNLENKYGLLAEPGTPAFQKWVTHQIETGVNTITRILRE